MKKTSKSILRLLLNSIPESFQLAWQIIKESVQKRWKEWAIMLAFAAIMFLLGFLAHVWMTRQDASYQLFAQVNPVPKAGEDAPKTKSADAW